jgi:hypothetical protein
MQISAISRSRHDYGRNNTSAILVSIGSILELNLKQGLYKRRS